MVWKPRLGACIENDGVGFRVWAPPARSMTVVLEPAAGGPTKEVPLQPEKSGFFTGFVAGVGAGWRYRYRINGDRMYPDPASRFQPEGVHGPSEVIEASSWDWTDENWRGLSMQELVLYEMHVGVFSPEGTFAGVCRRLQSIHDLGATAIELMPVADFPGQRNWGYDGVDLFAPARCYGRPDDLRRLVDRAHAQGLGVFLDVVYNHLGPEGAYLAAFSPQYFSSAHKSPWGDAVNLDGEGSRHVRDFFIENALHWVHEYHIDGLRVDATHALIDDSPTHFLKELAQRVRQSLPANRTCLIIAEDNRNHATLLRPAPDGYDLDGVWADDFHHHVRRLLAGDDEGYYQDYSGDTGDIAKTMRQGWFYTGQLSACWNRPRGSDPQGVPLTRFVYCIQNHDQVGNRAAGDRLNENTSLSAFRAASALLLFSPATPLLFMGQEWAASTPFCYFTDHPEPLGRQVTEGRRKQFRYFKAFRDPESRERIPDPQAAATFSRSRLDWQERERQPHAGVLRFYRHLLAFRRNQLAPPSRESEDFQVEEIAEHTLALKRRGRRFPVLLLVCLKGQSSPSLATRPITQPPQDRQWKILWTSEDPDFAESPSPPVLETRGTETLLRFPGPCAAALIPA